MEITVDHVDVSDNQQVDVDLMWALHAVARRAGVSKQMVSKRVRRFAEEFGLRVERDCRNRIVRANVAQYDELCTTDLIERLLNLTDDLAAALARDGNTQGLSVGLARQAGRPRSKIAAAFCDLLASVAGRDLGEHQKT